MSHEQATITNESGEATTEVQAVEHTESASHVDATEHAAGQSHAETESHSAGTSHTPTIFAEPIPGWEIAGVQITNSYLNSTVALVVLAVFFLLVGRKVRQVPTGIQNFFEMLLEGGLSFADSITGSRQKSEKFFPIVITLFLFILVNNWLGLLPGVGTLGFNTSHDGHEVFIPLFRGATADLNTTLALALFAVISTHIFGAMAVGLWTHVNKFFNFNAFIEIPKKFAKDPSIAYLNPIKAMVSLIEFIGEFARVASLSFRLFGNIFAGEVLLASMMAMFAFVLPLPFIFLEVLVGVIQASVFAILTLVFLSMSTEAHEH